MLDEDCDLDEPEALLGVAELVWVLESADEVPCAPLIKLIN
jgi:hypothetical protein